MNKIVLKSPAKINIGLNIIRKREDGYHDLETIFYPLLLRDILTFEKADNTTLESNSNEINSLKTNLIFTTIELLESIVDRKLNVTNFNRCRNGHTGIRINNGNGIESCRHSCKIFIC